MRFFNTKFYDVFSGKGDQTEGHWILAFEGTKAAIEEVYDYVLTAREDFYKEDYPDFVHDFEETKQFFVKKGRKWTPCKWEDCKDTDQVLLRANSLSPCDIERMEDNTLFFDLVDDMDDLGAQIVEAYCIWPLDSKLNGYLCYRFPDSGSPGFWIDDDYSVVLDRKANRIPPVITDCARFEHDEHEGTFVQGDVDIDCWILDYLGMEWSK